MNTIDTLLIIVFVITLFGVFSKSEKKKTFVVDGIREVE